MSEARCPVCALDLVDTDPGQRGCPKCRGTWLSLDGFASLVRAAGYARAVVVTDVEARTPRACPTCGIAMHAGTVFEVLVDRCLEHGVWADAGELSRIVLAARRAP